MHNMFSTYTAVLRVLWEKRTYILYIIYIYIYIPTLKAGRAQRVRNTN